MRNKDYLVKALSQLTPEEAVAVFTEAQGNRIKQREIPQAKIDALKKRHQALREVSSINFPINIQGQIKVELEWDGPEHCYFGKCELIVDNQQGPGAPVGAEFIRSMLDGDEPQYTDYTAQLKEEFEEKAAAVMIEIEVLAEEYNADTDQLVEEITDQPDRGLGRFPGMCKRKARKRLR